MRRWTRRIVWGLIIVIAVVLILASVFAMWLSALAMKGRDYATLQKGGNALQRRTLRGWEAVLAYGWVLFVLLVGGGLISAGAFIVWQGPQFFGVGLPFVYIIHRVTSVNPPTWKSIGKALTAVNYRDADGDGRSPVRDFRAPPRSRRPSPRC